MNLQLKDLLIEIDTLQLEIDKHRPFDAYLLQQIKEYFHVFEQCS